MGRVSAELPAINWRLSNMTAKKWYRSFVGIIAAVLLAAGCLVIWLDPFFHYHAPLKGFYYRLAEQRYQNDGITRHFDYDAVITGTSMVENFRTSQFSELFDVQPIKVPYPGATYREINDNLSVAFDTHEDIKCVIRALDYSHLVENKDLLRSDMGEYPDYLYDRNLLNDVKYLYNRSVLAGYAAPMIIRKLTGQGEAGVDSFDSYGFNSGAVYGPEQALEGRTCFERSSSQSALSEDEKRILTENVEKNIVKLAKEHPETTFYYFFPPYSAVWFGGLIEEGSFEKQLEAERIATEKMLECGNIRVFSFSAAAEITCDLNNYRDAGHYGPWINEYLLECFSEGKFEVTQNDLEERLQAQRDLYYPMDFNELIP